MSEQLLDTPSKHSLSLSGIADSAWNRLSEAAFRIAPVTKIAEAAVVAYVSISQPSVFSSDSRYRLMRNIGVGQLKVLTYSHIYTFPTHPQEDADDVGRKAELRVVNDIFWIRLCAMGDLGFAEAYMYGDVECDDLVSLFQVGLIFPAVALADPVTDIPRQP